MPIARSLWAVLPLWVASFCFLPFMSRCVVGVADSVRHGVTREFAIGAATVASPISYDDVLIEAGVNSISAVCMMLNGIYEKIKPCRLREQG